MSVETLSATEAARRFSEILNLVRYQGKSFEILRGKEPVARIVPTRASPSGKVSELRSLLAGLPKLTDEEFESFAKDLQSVRDAAGSPQERWE